MLVELRISRGSEGVEDKESLNMVEVLSILVVLEKVMLMYLEVRKYEYWIRCKSEFVLWLFYLMYNVERGGIIYKEKFWKEWFLMVMGIVFLREYDRIILGIYILN